ncbi:MAG: diaminopimelate epimerase [Gemmatimonadota bacterium]
MSGASSRELQFSKYTGAGNDFVIVRAEEVEGADPAAVARLACPRATGVGVDGLILLRPLAPRRIRLRFFNPDGSEFPTCGNGSRCAALYAFERNLAGRERLELVTEDGEVAASLDGSEVSLEYRLEPRVGPELSVTVEGTRLAGRLVFLGTPHFVLPLEAMPEQGFEDICRPIRHHPALGAAGVNVNLVQRLDGGSARIRTFERGVEGETLACGSGAMAAAVALREAGLCGPSLSVQTRSGASLRVHLEDSAPEAGPRRIHLTGPARRVFDGKFPVRIPPRST